MFFPAEQQASFEVLTAREKMRLDMHFQCSLWPLCKEKTGEPEDMWERFRQGGWLQESHEPSQYIFRRQNQQDQIMAACGMILGLLTLTSLTFNVIYNPRFGVINYGGKL